MRVLSLSDGRVKIAHNLKVGSFLFFVYVAEVLMINRASRWVSDGNESFERGGLISNQKLISLSARAFPAPIFPPVGMLRTSVRSRMISRIIRRGGRQTHMRIVGYLVLRPGL